MTISSIIWQEMTQGSVNPAQMRATRGERADRDIARKENVRAAAGGRAKWRHADAGADMHPDELRRRPLPAPSDLDGNDDHEMDYDDIAYDLERFYARPAFDEAEERRRPLDLEECFERLRRASEEKEGRRALEEERSRALEDAKESRCKTLLEICAATAWNHRLHDASDVEWGIVMETMGLRLPGSDAPPHAT